jgi:hypothetical protein
MIIVFDNCACLGCNLRDLKSNIEYKKSVLEVIRHQSVFIHSIIQSTMRAFTFLIVLVIFVALATAEPPRQRFKLRTFARQETTDNGEPSNDGYDYQPPQETQQLRLPARFRQFAFARQEQEQPMNEGYNYPKPNVTYGPPQEENTTPSSEYGTPDSTTEQLDETTDTSEDEPESTTNPQAETLKSIQASQLRRVNGKFIARSQKLVRAKIVQQQQQIQPIYYVDYPEYDLVQPQYVYIFK